METTNIHGFYVNEIRKIKPKKFTAINYLRNQLVFLHHIEKDLDSETKVGMMVSAQIPNLEMALDELGGNNER
ncbi:hypothetical protein [Leuconostoc mesenteroides]|uniref:hypothetical protein n=1 Tax=Leuconostoc mesenteroides TaxID=1245 RepID=UPI0032DF4FF5